MRMDTVEIADRGQHAPGCQIQAIRQALGLEEGFLDADAVVGTEGKGQLAGEQRIDIRAERELRLAEIEAAAARADLLAARHEALDAELFRVLRQVGISAPQDSGDGGIEGIGRCCGDGRRRHGFLRHGGCCGRLCCCGLGGSAYLDFGCLEALLERLDARFIVLPHLPDFFAQLRQFALVRGMRGERHGKGGRQRRRQNGRFEHDGFLA